MEKHGSNVRINENGQVGTIHTEKRKSELGIKIGKVVKTKGQDDEIMVWEDLMVDVQVFKPFEDSGKKNNKVSNAWSIATGCLDGYSLDLGISSAFIIGGALQGSLLLVTHGPEAGFYYMKSESSADKPDDYRFGLLFSASIGITGYVYNSLDKTQVKVNELGGTYYDGELSTFIGGLSGGTSYYSKGKNFNESYPWIYGGFSIGPGLGFAGGRGTTSAPVPIWLFNK